MRISVRKALYVLVQAFIAMGGEAGGKGSISTDKLRQIIKNEFEMTIDIDVQSVFIHYAI